VILKRSHFTHCSRR